MLFDGFDKFVVVSKGVRMGVSILQTSGPCSVSSRKICSVGLAAAFLASHRAYIVKLYLEDLPFPVGNFELGQTTVS